MDNIFEELDKLIVNQFTLNLSDEPELETAAHWLDLAQKQIHEIKQRINPSIHQLHYEKDIVQYIQYIHQKCINLSDILTHTLEQFFPSKQERGMGKAQYRIGMLKVIQLMVEDTIHLIDSRYSRYCDPYQKIPEYDKRLFVKRNVSLLNEISETGCEGPIEALRQPLEQLATCKKIHLDYRTRLYLTNLIRKVHQLYQCFKTDNLTERVDVLLLRYNFNTFYYFNYRISQLKIRLKELNSIKEKKNYLALCLKKLNQTLIKAGMVFNPEATMLKDLLTNWILEEINFLDGCYRTYERTTGSSLSVVSELKILTSLSVAQMAVIIRMLVETNIILNKNHHEVLKFFAGNFQSKKMENISQESLRAKYYSIEESSKEIVKHLMIEMLKKIQKM